MSISLKVPNLRRALARNAVAPDNIHKGVDETAQFTSANSASNLQLIQLCSQTILQFDQWDRDAAFYWQSELGENAASLRLGEITIKSLNYDSDIACTVILFRASRISLCSSLIDFCYKLQALGEVSHNTFGRGVVVSVIANAERDIRLAITDIISCVPYVISDFDENGCPKKKNNDGAGGLLILPAIKFVENCLYSSPDQVRIAHSILERINTCIGIRSARSVLDSQA